MAQERLNTTEWNITSFTQSYPLYQESIKSPHIHHNCSYHYHNITWDSTNWMCNSKIIFLSWKQYVGWPTRTCECQSNQILNKLQPVKKIPPLKYVSTVIQDQIASNFLVSLNLIKLTLYAFIMQVHFTTLTHTLTHTWRSLFMLISTGKEKHKVISLFQYIQWLWQCHENQMWKNNHNSFVYEICSLLLSCFSYIRMQFAQKLRHPCPI